MIPPAQSNSIDGACPPLIDLAAFAARPDPPDGRLIDDDQVALTVHLSRCESCVLLLRDLGLDVAMIESEARRLIVPRTVLEAAMNLRAADVGDAPELIHTYAGRQWLMGVRRGLAAAAALGIAIGGYHIGQALTTTSNAADSIASVNSTSDFGVNSDFAWLAPTSMDDGDDLFSLALSDVQGEGTVTP